MNIISSGLALSGTLGYYAENGLTLTFVLGILLLNFLEVASFYCLGNSERIIK